MEHLRRLFVKYAIICLVWGILNLAANVVETLLPTGYYNPLFLWYTWGFYLYFLVMACFVAADMTRVGRTDWLVILATVLTGPVGLTVFLVGEYLAEGRRSAFRPLVGKYLVLAMLPTLWYLAQKIPGMGEFLYRNPWTNYVRYCYMAVMVGVIIADLRAFQCRKAWVYILSIMAVCLGQSGLGIIFVLLCWACESGNAGKSKLFKYALVLIAIFAVSHIVNQLLQMNGQIVLYLEEITIASSVAGAILYILLLLFAYRDLPRKQFSLLQFIVVLLLVITCTTLILPAVILLGAESTDTPASDINS